jgi:hypothetical protein
MNQTNRLRLADFAGGYGETVATDAGRGLPTRVGGEASVAGVTSHENSAGGAVCSAGSFSRKHTPATIEKIRAKALERTAWSAEKSERIAAKLRAGRRIRAICREEHVDRGTVLEFAARERIVLNLRARGQGDMEAAALVLAQHYETNPDPDALLRLYRDARGDNPTKAAMRQHAQRMNLHRPRGYQSENSMKARQVMRARFHAGRQEMAEAMQALLNTHMGWTTAARRLKMCQRRAKRMLDEGLIALVPKPPKVKVARPVRVKVAKAPKPAKPAPTPKPKVLPKSWVRAEAPPPKPRPTFQTVEAWLAAGNRITQCPAAAAYVTTAELGEGREMIRQHAAVMAGDNGNWINRAKRKMGRLHFGVGK